MKIFHNDPIFDGQLLRILSATYEQGSDITEAHSTTTRITPHDTESWYKEWNKTATRIEQVAAAALAKHHSQTAHEAFLRASMYHRASGQFFIGNPDDKRTRAAFKNCETCFIEAMKLSTHHECERVSIPYKDTALPGYFLRPRTARRCVTLIINGGYDSTKEECFFFSGAAALRRGFNVLLFDGPGQGLALVEQNLITTHKWESVITPVVDYLYTRSDVDKSKIAAMGISLGGYQVPRAATKEKRLAAIIADPGQVDIGKRARARLPLPETWRRVFPKDTSWAVVSLVSTILARMSADPSNGWTMRRIKHVHGLDNIVDMFEEMDKFKLNPAEITCPCFVSCAENDELASDSWEFYERLGAQEKRFVRYKAADGGGEHCEAGNRSLFNGDCLDWLEELWS
ncbi:alpha/beta-hydrolase [Pochonia chlamydosporia 170]|uniref:Alpha/beta-hydrolase n=1 Tax=Pochonia chlamydosporia 170 TaxID=1380566 RepID=A0A179FYE3_METCM|nr:alpha/beta-hydrolase [Pochonia chlamydosporia 170]OAQ70407.1 alpha/beta-hydrolase [Pochonia chlamydosporia 170]